MKKESKRKGFSPEKSKGSAPSLHDLYFTEEIDIGEELRLMEADPRLKDVTGDPGTLDKIKAEWARMNIDVEMSEELTPVISEMKKMDSTDITKVVSEDELEHLSPEARELLELGLKAKAEEDGDEPKIRVIRKRNKRIFFAVAAIMVLSMAASTTGVTSLYKYLQVEEKGAEEQFRMVESERNAIKPDTFVDEAEIYKEVDKFFGASVVKLRGDLAGLEFQQVLFHEEDMSADLVYYWEGKSVFYSIQTNYNQISQMAGTNERLIEKRNEIIGDIEFNIEKYAVDNVDEFYYTVIFEYNNLYYKIGITHAKEDVLYKIIEYFHI